MKTNQPKLETIIRYRPWIQSRLDPKASPFCRIVGRELHPNREPTMTIHVAGESHLWVIPIRVAARNENILNALDEADRALVEWVYENDNMVEQYYYQDNDSQ